MISQHWKKAVRKKIEENLRKKIGERIIGGKFEEKLEGFSRYKNLNQPQSSRGRGVNNPQNFI